MARKTDTLPVEDRFFLNLDEDLTVELTYKDLSFTARPPSLLEEAALSLEVVTVARELLKTSKYQNLIDSITIPRITKNPDAEKDGDQPATLTVEDPINLDNVRHVRYALGHLPETFVSVVNNIAYMNLLVNSISFGGKEIVVQTEGREVTIQSFLDFVRFFRHRHYPYSEVITSLYQQFNSWSEVTDIGAEEVKN